MGKSVRVRVLVTGAIGERRGEWRGGYCAVLGGGMGDGLGELRGTVVVKLLNRVEDVLATFFLWTPVSMRSVKWGGQRKERWSTAGQRSWVTLDASTTITKPTHISLFLGGVPILYPRW